MSKTLTASLLVLAVSMLGCGKESPPGGPGAERQAANGEQGTADEERTFRLSVPEDVNVEQGETKNVTISLDKGDDFRQSVTLELDLPEGVRATPDKPTIPADQDEVEVALEASLDAPAGEKKVTVTGKPQEGKETSVSFVVEIEQADDRDPIEKLDPTDNRDPVENLDPTDNRDSIKK